MARRILSFDLGTRNLACCHLEAASDPGAPPAIRDWSVVDILVEDGCRVKDCRTVPLSKLVEHLLAYARRREPQYRAFDPDVVAIEQQPSSRFCPNTKTKVLSHVLQAYFRLALPRAEVVFVNPKQPKKHLEAAAEIKKIKKSGSRYAKTKKLAVDETRRLLAAAGDAERVAWFDAQKKRDDLADSYLQGLYVLRPPKAPRARKRKRAALTTAPRGGTGSGPR